MIWDNDGGLNWLGGGDDTSRGLSDNEMNSQLPPLAETVALNAAWADRIALDAAWAELHDKLVVRRGKIFICITPNQGSLFSYGTNCIPLWYYKIFC